MKNAVVVGAGIAGIASAIRLAVQGYKVQVFEANAYPGGKLTSFSQDSFRFDAGPSLFTLPQLVEELFLLAGKTPSDYFQYHQKEVACNYFWEDKTRFSAFFDQKKLGEEIENKLQVSSKPALEHLAHSKFLYETTAKIFLEKSLHKTSTWWSKDVAKSLSQIHKLGVHTTMHAQNEKKLNHPKLVQVFDRYATYNGSNPYKAPGILGVIPHLEQGVGTFFPKGGMVSITQSLVRLAEELGVDFLYNFPVQKIDVRDGRAVGVLAGDQFYPASLVMCNSDVVPAYRNLLQDQPQPEKILSRERSSSALIFYWGVEGVFPELELHNIFFSETYKAEFEALFGTKTIINDPTVYIHVSSKEEAKDAPKNCENWFVMVNAPADYGQDWDEMVERTRQNIIEKLSRNLEINLAEKIKAEALLTPPEIAAKTSSFRGALYGAASNDKMAAFLRHPNFSKNIDKLYFCGGSAHPGGGIPLCLLSAKIATELAAKDEQ